MEGCGWLVVINISLKTKVILIISSFLLLVLALTVVTLISRSRQEEPFNLLITDAYGDQVETKFQGETVADESSIFTININDYLYNNIDNYTLNKLKFNTIKFIKEYINASEIKAVVQDDCIRDYQQYDSIIKCSIRTKNNTETLYLSILIGERNSINSMTLTYNQNTQTYSLF